MFAVSTCRCAAVALTLLMALAGHASAEGTMPLPFGPAASQPRAPWHVTGVVTSDKPGPFNLSRAAIEESIPVSGASCTISV